MAASVSIRELLPGNATCHLSPSLGAPAHRLNKQRLQAVLIGSDISDPELPTSHLQGGNLALAKHLPAAAVLHG